MDRQADLAFWKGHASAGAHPQGTGVTGQRKYRRRRGGRLTVARTEVDGEN